MSTNVMGRVLVEARIENLSDLYMVEEGLLPPDQVRTVVVGDALVDTGATILIVASPPDRPTGPQARARCQGPRTPAGPVTLQTFSAVRLTIQGRDCLSDVSELPDDCPAPIGQVPLELLDFVVDMKDHRLIGNPIRTAASTSSNSIDCGEVVVADGCQIRSILPGSDGAGRGEGS